MWHLAVCTSKTNFAAFYAEYLLLVHFGQMVTIVLCFCTYYVIEWLDIHVGPNWPSGGEIDIIEGVHDSTKNQATIHTNPGCKIASSDSEVLKISGKVVGGTDCSSVNTGNQGCGVRAISDGTYGAEFNRNGGGVYASTLILGRRAVSHWHILIVQWDTSGIAIYFFPHGHIPPDINADIPQPLSWGNALARWPATLCNPFKFFKAHSIIFDTTLWWVIMCSHEGSMVLFVCSGDWASGAWTSSGEKGNNKSCAQRTGFQTCEAFVKASGSSFKEACEFFPQQA